MKHSRSWWGILIPRPHSFLMNSLLFGAGAFFAWLEGYRVSAGTHTHMPAWLFVLLWYFAQELCVQQAKYMWNDIRDHQRDQQLPANRTRPIARQPLSPWLTAVMAGRWLLGVLLAGWLSPVLLTVVLMISGLQIIYELRAKPHAWHQPLLPLFIVGAGMVIKTGAGALALGVLPGEQRFWLYGVALFATGVVFVSSFWRVEADYFDERGLASPRGQSGYFGDKGLAWLKTGTLVTILCCTVLLFDSYAHFLREVAVQTGTALSVIIMAGVVSCCLGFWLVESGTAVRAGVAVVYLTACAVFIVTIDSILPISKETYARLLFLTLLLLDHRLNVNLDYKQQNLLYFVENWPKFKCKARERPYRQGIPNHWRSLLELGVILNTAKFDAVQERQEREALAGAVPTRADSPIQNPEVRGEGRTS